MHCPPGDNSRSRHPWICARLCPPVIFFSAVGLIVTGPGASSAIIQSPRPHNKAGCRRGLSTLSVGVATAPSLTGVRLDPSGGGQVAAVFVARRARASPRPRPAHPRNFKQRNLLIGTGPGLQRDHSKPPAPQQGALAPWLFCVAVCAATAPALSGVRLEPSGERAGGGSVRRSQARSSPLPLPAHPRNFKQRNLLIGTGPGPAARSSRGPGPTTRRLAPWLTFAIKQRSHDANLGAVRRHQQPGSAPFGPKGCFAALRGALPGTKTSRTPK